MADCQTFTGLPEPTTVNVSLPKRIKRVKIFCLTAERGSAAEISNSYTENNKMSFKICLNFDKPTVSRGVIDLLENGLVEDTEQTLSKLTLKECLSVIARGNKLQYASANYLLNGLLKMLSLEDSHIDDEILPAGSQEEKDLGRDATLSQSLREGGSHDDTEDSGEVHAQEVKELSTQNGSQHNKKKETCRFYTNGNCKFNSDCRFAHPKVCPKFRKHGDCKTKGCGGDCEFLHPNVCRNSLKDRTCSYKECRFFHLKGTKTVERAQNFNNASNSNWRSNNQSKDQVQSGSGSQRAGSRPDSKNWPAGLNQKGKMKKKTNPRNQVPKQKPTPVQTATQEEKKS